MLRENENGRVEVFIDGQTFFYLQKEALQWWVDPSRLLEWIEEEIGEISQANYFHRLNPEGQNKEEAYLKALAHIGFRVCPIPDREYFSNESNLGTMTPEILVELIGRAPSYDHAVLIGNELDYLPALRWLHANNKRYTVLGSKNYVSQELLAHCGQNFEDLNEEETKDRIFKER